MSNLYRFGRALRDYAAGKAKSDQPGPDQITRATLFWAQQHDWGRNAFLVGPALCGLNDVQVHADGTVTESDTFFTSRFALRAWAGY
jgi:hypothetical protein